MSSGGGDGEPASAKKRGSGPMTLTRVANVPNKLVLFDKFGRPIYDRATTSYPSTLEVLLKANIPVKHRVWSDVPKDIKTKIWLEIKMAWSLSDNHDLQKEVTRCMVVHFKRFRHDLNKDYVKEGSK